MHRVYCALGLNRRRLGKKRLPPRDPAPLAVPAEVNRSHREAVLDMHVFKTLDEVRERTETWMADYNEVLPHDSLGDLTPVEYRVLHHPETSSNGPH